MAYDTMEMDEFYGGDNSSPKMDSKGAMKGAGQAIQSGGSTTDILSGALMGSGNPYAMGASVGLAVLSAREKRKQAEQKMLYKAKLENISRQQAVISNLMNLTQRLTL